MLDTHITGGGGGLAMAVGGPDEVVQRVQAALDDVGSVTHCGPVGAATVLRLAAAMIGHATRAAVHEARALTTAAGIADEHLIRAMARPGSDPIDLTGIVMAGPECDRPEAVGRARAELAAVQDYAGDLGIEVPITDIAATSTDEVCAGTVAVPLSADPDVRGRAMMDRVYGPGFGARIPTSGNNPLTDDIVHHLFADIWGRSHLTVRDRRLLVLGITATLGRADLLDVQLHGALANHEFTPAQLDEIPLMVSYYAGVGTGTAINTAIRAATGPATRPTDDHTTTARSLPDARVGQS
ncbi:carboxymuconolactone decarboxylase family protein [Nocardia sp. BMG111209]|uniref:carboxymuconolactone decarboxylase family protein n=1 Tax=Nocardia sp. BMG111209 TaxID=1160137 RepID=UPI00037EEA17|nr:carboxymuconolactone decarboxylase family protein [Nocardia sp. BMG111209]